MLGKTHFSVGVAAAIAVTQPATLSEMILAVGMGGMGALISDIDAGTSESHRDADKITMFTILIVLGVFASDYFFHTGMIDRIIKSSGYGQMITGFLLFIGICAFGKEQPHRSFMHSLLAMLLLCLTIHLVWQKAVPYFAVGFLSHLALDLFNKKRIRLLYPLKSGVAFGLFKSDGLVNHLLFLLGSVAAALEIGGFILGIFSFL